MVKSLDDLIRYLIDEIALCGEEGALPPDFNKYINAYYGEQPQQHEDTVTRNDDNDGNKSDRKTITIDRPFQEQVWKWLTHHPEIRVGKNNEGKKSSLFEVEALNTARLNEEQSKQPEADRSILAHNAATSSSRETQTPSGSTSNESSIAAKKRSDGLPAKLNKGEEPQSLGGLRLYGSENRLWQVAAGHALDHSKVPAMDFVCLSIIAARGPKGILQPELVAVSGQDNRSLPKRTDRLQANGYIEKKPVLVSGSRTSLCTLKRFVTTPCIVDGALLYTEETSSPHHKKDGVVDLRSLTQSIFDNLRDLEIITTEDLKRKLGVWGLRWPMKVLARTLRQLEALGCVKQVRAQANSNIATSIYFKCIKLIREPDEKEWQLFLSPHRGLSNTTTVGDNEDLDAAGELQEDYGLDEIEDRGTSGISAPVKDLREVGRPIAQWGGDQCLNNYLFDLINRTGTHGMSTMDIKRFAFGGLVKRPLEYQLGRLVNQWQVSQPLHLRHKAIIRDTAMNKTVAHYVHYSYENFNALVNSGKASWEAVETLSENKKRAKNSVAAVNAEPDLDEYGFPKLQATLFQGQHNDATLSECALAVNAKPIYLNRFDLIPKKLDDGTHAVRHAPKPRMSQGHRSPCTPRAPKKDTPRKLSFKPRGRPRKVPRTGLPANVDSMTPKEIKNFARLQQAAIKYDVLKIEKEIDRRVSAGENPANALDTVLDEVADEHAKLGLPSSLAAEAVRVRAEMPGDRENKPILPADVVAGIAGEVKINSPRLVKKGGRPNGKMKMHVYEYVPSVIAHSQPVLSQPLLAPTIDLEPTPKRAPRLSSTRCRSMDITYMPSVIAHTQPVLRPSTLARSTTTTQRKQNPTRGAGREKRKASPDFASVTDLLRSQTAPDGLSGNISSARKKRKRGLPTENIESLDFENAPIGDWSLKRKRSEVECHTSNKRGTPEYLPSIAAHSQMPFHVRERLSGSHVRLHTKPRESSRGCSLGDLTQNASQESWANRILNSRTESEMKNYRKHLNEIQRPKDGIFIGSRSVVYRKGGKGPRKSQLAIFKLQRLDKFSWFQTETSSSDGILQSTTSKDCETRTSAHTHYSSALSQLDNDHPGVGAFDAPPARASSGAQMDFTHVPGLGPLFGEKETRRASSVDPHIHPSVDSTSTSTNETSSPTSFQNAQKATPSDPSNRTTSTLLMSFAKKRPHDPEHEDALDKSLRMKNNSASNGIEPLNSITDQLSPSQQARFISSRVSIDGCTPEGALELQEEETRPLEVTRDAPGVHEESRLSINQTPFQDGITRSSSLADDHLANVSLEDTVKDPVETKKRSRAKAIPKLSLTGGSVGLLRKKIVMDIVQNCGGVFPSDRELVYPFAYAWQKEGKPGAPEKPTVTAACKSLYASGKLRQLYFSFKDKKGLMVTKSMMTVPEISPTDPKVKEIQQKIIEFYPRPYIPDKAEVSEDVRNRFSSPQVYGTNRTFPHLEIDHESRVQLQHKPQYVQRIESMRNLRGYVPEQKGTSEPGGMTETSTSTITDLVSNELVVGSKQNLSSHVSASIRGSIRRPDLDPASNPPVRKVERLASIRKPRSGLDTSHKFSQYVSRRQVQPSAEESSRKSHLNLPSEALQAQVRVSDMRSNNTIDPEVNLRGRAADKVNSTGTWRQGNFFSSAFSTEARSPQSGLPFTTGQSLCLAPSEEAWVLPKKRAPYKKRIKPYLPSIAAHTQPYLRPTRRYIFKRYLPSIAAHTQPIYKPVTIKRKHTKQSQPTELSNDLVSRASTKASGIKVKYALKTSGTLSIDPWYAHRQMSTIMDPDHHFHPASGTFSTIFTAPKMRGRRTQTIAKPEAPLADQVYPNWSFSDQPSIDWISDQRAHNKTAFDAEVDKMLHWELETESFAHAAFANPSFINFVFHHPHKLSTNAFIDMDKVVNVSFSTVDDHILYKPFTPSIAPRPEVDRKVLSKETRQAAPVVPAAAAEAATPAKRKQQKEPMEKFMSRRLTSLPGGHGYGRTKPLKEASSRLDADGRPIKIRRIRGPQILQGLGEHGERRLIFATLVIRTLTGGLERHIDWVLVARLFAPKFDQMFVQNRWNAVLNKYRFEYERLYAEFQDMFAQAYEDGLVPPIDYDDLESYDWAWLVDWTMENIEAPSKNVPGLPAERVKFDDRFATRETHENNLHAFYETDVAHALPARTSNILKQSFALPLNLNCASIPAQEPKQFAVAKSWIRANIITPEASYNPDLARAKLLAFNETTIELALKELMGSRILSQQNKGRLVPGRNYNIAQHVLDRLKKSLDVERFLCAAVYKRQLDKNLEKNGAVEFSPTANDGIVLAVMNMQAHGRIEIRPKNPPMNKFGLTDGGYETRKMDKSRLNFSCEIRPRNSYISGNPLLPLPPPPSQHLETPMSKIPLWYDIHDKLVPAVWEIVLVATMAVLALRPGIGAKEIEKSMRPALEAWELNQVLGWMVLAKVAKKVGKGFTVEEWWWLCMETGNREKDSGAEAEGDTNMDTEGN